MTSTFVLTFRKPIDEYVGAPVAYFILLLVLVDLLRAFTNAGLKGSHLVHIYAPLSTLKTGTRSLSQIIAVSLGWGLAGILIGYATGGFLVVIIGLYILKFKPAIPTKQHFISLFNYAKFSWLGSIRGRAFSSIDILVLGFFVQTGLVGVYTIAWSIGKFLDIFGEAIGTTLFPEMSKVASEKEVQTVGNLTEDALSFAGLILIPGLVGSIIIGDRLLLVFGENFPQGASILVVLVGALLVYTYNKQILNTLNAIDRPDLSFRANGAFIIANVIFNIYL